MWSSLLGCTSMILATCWCLSPLSDTLKGTRELELERDERFFSVVGVEIFVDWPFMVVDYWGRERAYFPFLPALLNKIT